MMNDDRFEIGAPSFEASAHDAAVQQFVTRTYGWMSAGLALTAVIAMFVASSPEIVQTIFGNRLIFYIL